MKCLRISLLALLAGGIGAFTNPPVNPYQSSFGLNRDGRQTRESHRTGQSTLQMGGIFDDIQKFFMGGNNNDDDDEDSEHDFNAENRLATIPGMYCMVFFAFLQ